MNRSSTAYHLKGFVAGKCFQDERFLLRNVHAFTGEDAPIAVQLLGALKVADGRSKLSKGMLYFSFANILTRRHRKSAGHFSGFFRLWNPPAPDLHRILFALQPDRIRYATWALA